MRVFTFLVFVGFGALGVAGVIAQDKAAGKEPTKIKPLDEPAQKPVYVGLERKEFEVVFKLVDAKDQPVIADGAMDDAQVYITRHYGKLSWPEPVRHNADLIEAKLPAGEYQIDALLGNYGLVSKQFQVSDKPVVETLKFPCFRRVIEFVFEDADGNKLTYLPSRPEYKPKEPYQFEEPKYEKRTPRLRLPLDVDPEPKGGRFAHRRARGYFKKLIYETSNGSVWVVVFAGVESGLKLPFAKKTVKYDSKHLDVDVSNFVVTCELEESERIEYDEKKHEIRNKDDVGYQSLKNVPDAISFRTEPKAIKKSSNAKPIPVDLSRTASAAFVSSALGLLADSAYLDGNQVWLAERFEDVDDFAIGLYTRGAWQSRCFYDDFINTTTRKEVLVDPNPFGKIGFAHSRSDHTRSDGFSVQGIHLRLVDANGHGVPMAEVLALPLDDDDTAKFVREVEFDLRENHDYDFQDAKKHAVDLHAVSDKATDDELREVLDDIHDGFYDALRSRAARMYFCKHGTWYDPWTQMRGDTDGYFIAPEQKMIEGKKYALYVWTNSTDDLDPDYRFVFEGQGETTDLGCIVLKDG